jgi:hypothetical protein
VSKIDTVFGPLPAPLISEWGQPVTFVRRPGSGTYDPTTGDITLTETRIPVKAVITRVGPKELDGNLQATDLKIMIDPGQIGGQYITTEDHWEIPQAGVTTTAKVISLTTYRGDNPVFFVCIARPQ